MLKVQNLSITLGQGTSLERHIIQNLNLEVQQGEFVVIIGSNGAGKSTFFNAISGDVSSDRGKILISGKNVTHLPNYKRSHLIAKVFQDPRQGTMPDMTIEENLSFAYRRGLSRYLFAHKTKKRLDFFKEQVSRLGMNLETRMDELVACLSGGQRQALSLVMATLRESQVLLLDELTSALDPKMGDLVMGLTEKIVRQNNQTTLLITHNMSYALNYGDRLIILHQGQIFKEYPRKEKKNLKPQDLFDIFEKIS